MAFPSLAFKSPATILLLFGIAYATILVANRTGLAATVLDRIP